VRRFIHFLQYNNLVSIGFFLLFGSVSWALASNDVVRDSVYSSEQEVVSVDNTYLLDTNLKRYDFNFRITNITEDDDQYYIIYKYNTITVIDYVWQDAEIEAELTISKKAVQGKDLGLYVAKQIGEVLNKHLTYLEQIQEKEEGNGVSVKVVTTKYKGLVGKMFDPKDQAFDGYRPVVKEERRKEKERLLAEASISNIALPYIPTKDEIQSMFESMYQQMIRGEIAGATTTSTDNGTTTDQDDNEDVTEDDTDNQIPDTIDDTATSTNNETSSTTPDVSNDASVNNDNDSENGNDTSSSTEPSVEETPVQEPVTPAEPEEPETPDAQQSNENEE